MKKHTYRAVKVKSVEISRLEADVRGKELIIGIDIGKHLNFASLVTREGNSLMTVKWEQPSQTREFVRLIKSLPASSCAAVMEPSGSYGDALRSLLWKDDIKVYRVSPKRSHDAAEVYDGVPSLHDAKSAAIIAKLHIDGASVLWPMKAAQERDIRAAIDTMDMFSLQHLQNLNRLEASLARFWPEVLDAMELKSVTLAALLAEFGSPSEVVRREEDARALIQKSGRYLLSAQKIDMIIDIAKKTTGVEMTSGEEAAIRTLAEEIIRARSSYKQAKRKVERLSKKNASVDGMSCTVGVATAAVIFSEVGDPLKYSCAKEYEKSAGLNLKEKSSGKHKGRLKITKRGSGKARRWLYLAVLRLIQSDPCFKAWYLRKVKRNGGLKMPAIIALMRKLIRALWHVARGENFDSTKLFDVKRLKLAV